MRHLAVSFLYFFIALPAIKGNQDGPISLTDNAKIIHFNRRIEKFGKIIEYDHKGIIYIPSVSHQNGPLFDSGGRLIDRDRVYVIHLWIPDESKRKSSIRIDPLDEVIQGSNFQVLPDSPLAFPPSVVIERAISRIGKLHRARKYNVVLNNCGNFVHWAKEGRSDRDNQFWEKSDQTIGRIIGRKPAGKLVALVRNVIVPRTNRKHPDF